MIQTIIPLLFAFFFFSNPAFASGQNSQSAPHAASQEGGAETSKATNSELHVISIKTPLISSDFDILDYKEFGQIIPPSPLGEPVDVLVDRPGKSVSLILVSEDLTSWAINAAPQTGIAKIYVLSGDARSHATFESKSYDAIGRTDDPLYTGDPNSLYPFQNWVTQEIAFLKKEGFEKFDSFQNDQIAPEQGYEINDFEPLLSYKEHKEGPGLLITLLPEELKKGALENISNADFGAEGFHFENETKTIHAHLPKRLEGAIEFTQKAFFSEERNVFWGVSQMPDETLLHQYTLANNAWNTWAIGTQEQTGNVYYDPQTQNILIATFTPNTNSSFRLMSFDTNTQNIRYYYPNNPYFKYKNQLDSESMNLPPLPEIRGLFEDSLLIGLRSQKEGGETYFYVLDLVDDSTKFVSKEEIPF